ncbi:MAG: 4Fe-4S dicluster domain-containing protein [Clostridiaceae bacterium]
MKNKKNVKLMKFDSNVQMLKYTVLESVSRYEIEGKLMNSFYKIPKEIIKGPDPVSRCCIYKERAIVEERVQMAIGGDKDNKNIVEVLEIACDECPVTSYTVTDRCRGCVAHKCVEACPFGAISLVDKKAVINRDLCKECGKCKAACPFEAISYVQRPCIKSCEAKAISINQNNKAIIDEKKCIQCGNCVYNCPFGAIMDKSYVTDVIKLIKDGKMNKYNVYAIVAPAISSQFSYAKIGQVVTAIKELGFHQVLEAALGADIVALNEASDFASEIEELKVMTTSCCPAFASYIRKNYPELSDNISTSVSPMIAVARLIKDIDKTAKVVFIGPCIAKKGEILEDDLKGSCDFVLTFEELLAYLDAADICIEDMKESPLDNASFFGRIFARSGGVTESIKHVIEDKKLDVEFKPIICNGLKECNTALKLAKIGKLNGNFIEGMACLGGCIGGPATLSRKLKDKKEVDKYGNMAIEKSINDSVRIFNIDNINLKRNK